MGSLNALMLLEEVSRLYKREISRINRKEISAKINEIKYLASQKKVPKLSLRKKISLLEEHLQEIYELEKTMLKKKNTESRKIKSLKEECRTLRQKLAMVSEKDLHYKVDKLNYFLGDKQAKRDAAAQIELAQAKKRAEKNLEVNVPVGETNFVSQTTTNQLLALQQHLEKLKLRIADCDPQKVEYLKVKMDLIERRLKKYQEQFPLPPEEEVKHTNLLQHTPPPQKHEVSTAGLPHPPPLKMTD